MAGPSARAPDEPRSLLKPAELGIGRLFDSIRDAVVVSDEDGDIVLWNTGAIAMFGYTSQEAARLNVRDIVPPELRGRHDRGMERFAESGRGEFIDSNSALELPALRKDRSTIYVELTLNRADIDGRRFAIALIRDVTDRVALREELESRNAALLEANESLEAFAYVVSHDLKEPVRAILAFSEALEESYADQLPAEARDLVQRTANASNHLGRLVEGLLEFSRAGQPMEGASATTLEEALEDVACASRLGNLVQERRAHVEIRPGPAVFAPIPVLCQALGNTVLNAIRHNGHDEPRVRLGATLSAEDHRFVEIVVEDNGTGFPVSIIERFDRLKRSRPATLRGGFGLLIARRAIERLGGEMWLGRSPDLGGAAVHMTLPAAPTTD